MEHIPQRAYERAQHMTWNLIPNQTVQKQRKKDSVILYSKALRACTSYITDHTNIQDPAAPAKPWPMTKSLKKLSLGNKAEAVLLSQDTCADEQQDKKAHFQGKREYQSFTVGEDIL